MRKWRKARWSRSADAWRQSVAEAGSGGSPLVAEGLAVVAELERAVEEAEGAASELAVELRMLRVLRAEAESARSEARAEMAGVNIALAEAEAALEAERAESAQLASDCRSLSVALRTVSEAVSGGSSTVSPLAWRVQLPRGSTSSTCSQSSVGNANAVVDMELTGDAGSGSHVYCDASFLSDDAASAGRWASSPGPASPAGRQPLRDRNGRPASLAVVSPAGSKADSNRDDSLPSSPTFAIPSLLGGTVVVKGVAVSPRPARRGAPSPLAPSRRSASTASAPDSPIWEVPSLLGGSVRVAPSPRKQ